MKLRQTIELEQHLSQELATRKRELTTALFSLGKARTAHTPYLSRAAVCIVYAHWEGFVKSSATAYLNHIDQQGHTYKELSTNIVALCIKTQSDIAEKSGSIMSYLEIAMLLIHQLHVKADIPWDKLIHTGWNLTSTRFKDILTTIGIDYSPYSTKFALIDEKLIYYRNSVAHGQLVEVDVDEIRELQAFVISSLESIKDDLLRAADNKSYLVSTV